MLICFWELILSALLIYVSKGCPRYLHFFPGKYRLGGMRIMWASVGMFDAAGMYVLIVQDGIQCVCNW